MTPKNPAPGSRKAMKARRKSRNGERCETKKSRRVRELRGAAGVRRRTGR